MPLSDIRARIKTILETVSGIGVVYEYERFAKDWNKFLDLFKTDDGKINGWMITRRATPSQMDGALLVNRSHRMVLRGIYGLKDDDASELVFQGIIEGIQNAVDASTFGAPGRAGVRSIDPALLGRGPLQVDLVEARQFGNVLCHWAECSLTVEEQIRR